MSRDFLPFALWYPNRRLALLRTFPNANVILRPSRSRSGTSRRAANQLHPRAAAHLYPPAPHAAMPKEAFLPPPSALQPRAPVRRATQPRRCVCMVDPGTVGTGYAFLDSLKGVVIGPTINEITAAIAGGTVGVMGTIITLEVRRQRVKERKQCPYCRGTGKLPCAACHTVGTIPCGTASTAMQGCTACAERGYLQCNHCDGDGRLIPWLYERAIRAQYEDYVYTASDDYYQDGPPYV